LCEPDRVLDVLRGIFIYAVAFLFPLAGLILVVIRLVDGERVEAARLAACTVLGLILYSLVFAV